MVCLDNLVGKHFWRLKGGRRQGGYYSDRSNAFDRMHQNKGIKNSEQTPSNWGITGGSMADS